MTNEEQKLRELVNGISAFTTRKELMERITALISEHYYPKEFVSWLLNGYTFLKRDQSFVVNYPYLTEHNDYRHFTTDELFNYWKENVR